MTEISSGEQLGLDFDWFAVDADGSVGHFTTAGFKHLPKSVQSSADGLKLLTEYFESGALPTGKYKVDADSHSEFKILETSKKSKRYLASFVGMAAKGLFSYDIETYVKPGLAYFRVAIPIVPILAKELPIDIQRVLEKTKLQSFSFAVASRVDYEATLDV